MIERRAVRIVAMVALLAAALLGPAGATPAAAATDGLSIVTKSAYTLDPKAGVVHVSIDVTAANNKPNHVQPSAGGMVTTRYFYQGAAFAIQSEASHIRALAGTTSLPTTTLPKSGFKILEVRFANDLYYKESLHFRVSFDLPGGGPRSTSDIRVGSAFATFNAWAFGDRGDVSISIPAGFGVETTGSTVTKGVKKGATTLAATSIGAVDQWYVVVVADRPEALTSDRLDLADGEHLVIHAWPEDKEWRTRVAGLMRKGLPVLAGLVGLDWPVSGDIRVTEVHSPLLEGFAGVFYTGQDRIEISEDLDELTIIHEASHAWFNSALFTERWINEGFADEYASRVLDRVSAGGLAPDPVAPDDAAAVRLNEWTHPGRIADTATQARESYGYNASWTVMRTLVNDVGEERMRAVLAAANAKTIAYVGAGTAETASGATDWRRFLDLLDQLGNATQADDAFRRWIVTDAQKAILDTRAQARTAYAALVKHGAGWLPGFVIRDPMARWDFGIAAPLMTQAQAILATRDRINGAAGHLGVTSPAALRTAYESATAGLGPVAALADDELRAATALEDASAALAAPRDALVSLGLIGRDPEVSLAAARQAFTDGAASAARDDAEAVRAILAAAPEAGRDRALAAGGAGLLVVGGVGSLVILRRRRRSDERRSAAAYLPAEPDSYATLAARPPVERPEIDPAPPDGDGGDAS